MYAKYLERLFHFFSLSSLLGSYHKSMLMTVFKMIIKMMMFHMNADKSALKMTANEFAIVLTLSAFFAFFSLPGSLKPSMWVSTPINRQHPNALTSKNHHKECSPEHL
jgi:hypothetical protein